MTEADHTSETRFGPRPVPKGHHVPHGTPHARRVIPSGRVSPDGRSAYPSPATGTKIAVWGGIALGVAGGTAAAVLAVRKIAEAISDDSPSGQTRHHTPPHFARMDEDEREAMRRRVRAQDREDRQEIARLRADAAQRRSATSSFKPSKARKRNFAESLIETSTKLSESLEGVAKSMALAVESFRSVAGQATEIVQEFAGAADQLRSALRGEQPGHPRHSDGDDRTHRL
ncbi:hypothetical protein [Paracoccus sp. WLY502]|uniref:hypothetical protein n=1 Tax=Paracoccus yibinensis TaxID=3068891 RepID=UPI0027BAA808|nr:hypothetical protein [Paracoccus sp. WLY502]